MASAEWECLAIELGPWCWKNNTKVSFRKIPYLTQANAR